VAQSTNKKVIVARFDRESVPGFVQTPGGLLADAVELLTPSGSLMRLPYQDVKAVCFVRDLDGNEIWREHRNFAARPKTPGLWVKLLFRDGDSTEGLIANNLMTLESAGFYITPPDPSFQSQRIFVPREALREVQVLGVIGSPLKRKRAAKPAAGEAAGQLEMF
jgi:hypothetical protein